MIMKKTLLIIAVFAGIFAVSCQKENIQGGDSSERSALQFTASIEDGAGTKTIVERVNGTPATYKTKWENTDKISINGTVYTATPKTDATQATFTKVSGNDPTAPFKAYYPNTMYNGTTATLPATYNYAEGKYNMPMYAESSINNLSFKNLCGVLAITVPGSLFTVLPGTQFSSVSSITVISDQQMNGAFTATVEGVLTFTSKTLTADDKKVTLTFSEAKKIEKESSATFYIPVPAGTHNPLAIIVSNGSVASYMITKKSGGVTVERNTVYPITFYDNQSDILPGVFSVSTTKRVCFSKGNLQYQASTNTWQFAANQYLYIGNKAGNNTATMRDTQSGWIDLFGWGATGQNSYGQQPYSISTTESDYKTVATASGDETLTIDNKSDWGYCMGGESSIWRTLTKDEWNYLLSSSGRGSGNTKFKYGVTVCGVSNCLVIAPDGNTEEIADNYNELYGWPSAKVKGFVCLPPAGYRDGSKFEIYDVDGHGLYWTSTAASSTQAYPLIFTKYAVQLTNPVIRSSGYSVRLVTDAQ